MAAQDSRFHSAARRRLHAWYRRERRDLPWRRTMDPYAIWVSEIMLQQTRVAVVVPYYERFLKRFPDAERLARARLDTVLALWSGLGYYRRARMLHEAAKRLWREGFPRDAAGWRSLPGVGAYTAAAIASIAFGEEAAVVDGNVERVLCRLFARRSRGVWVRQAAQAFIEGARGPGDHNQAVMELGALVCTPRAPQCPRCPLQSICAGSASPHLYPQPRRRLRFDKTRVHVVLARRGKEVFLRRGGTGGFWDLPRGREGRVVARVSHSIFSRNYEIVVREGEARGRGTWFHARALRRIPLATAARKCLAAVSRSGTAARARG